MSEPRTMVEVVARAGLFKIKLNTLLSDFDKSNINREGFPKPETHVEFEVGRRYIRMVRVQFQNQRAVHCFIDLNNGNVLKANGWKVHPTPRSNIFDMDVGMSGVTVYGCVRV